MSNTKMLLIPSSKNITIRPYGCPDITDLNATEFIWDILKTKVAHNNFGQSAIDIQNILMQTIRNAISHFIFGWLGFEKDVERSS